VALATPVAGAAAATVTAAVAAMNANVDFMGLTLRWVAQRLVAAISVAAEACTLASFGAPCRSAAGGHNNVLVGVLAKRSKQ
jgi:hypothetical protein